MYSASAVERVQDTEQHLNQPTGAGADRRVAQSAAAARDGGAAAGVGVGLAAGAAVVVGGAAQGAGHVVPPQRAVADVAVAALQHLPGPGEEGESGTGGWGMLCLLSWVRVWEIGRASCRERVFLVV